MVKREAATVDDDAAAVDGGGSKDEQHGMSRAAKKRRAKKKQKKKQKQKQQQQRDPTEQDAEAVYDDDNIKKASHDDTTTNDDDNNVQSRKKDQKQAKVDRSENSKKDHVAQDASCIENDHFDDDADEEMAMKDDDLDDEQDVIAEVARGCQFLRDIVVEDDNSSTNIGDDDDDASDISNTRLRMSLLTSRQRAQCALAFLLQDRMSISHFYKHYWEQKPLLIQQAGAKTTKSSSRNRFDGFLCKREIQKIMQTQTLYYAKDLNVTRYEKSDKDGLYHRVTFDKLPATTSSTTTSNHAGKEDAAQTRQHPEEDDMPSYVPIKYREVWELWNRKGCTIRLLCPHKLSANIHALLSYLELEWGCMVGANAYLTPPRASQGFAPHYDDIEAFCLQLEGRKRWKVYKPLSDQVLPRYSSRDFTNTDVQEKLRDPVLDVVLEPGDLLYMPRGWIHQACTLPEEGSSDGNDHSLHLTVSAMQQWAWADLMEILIPEALATTIQQESAEGTTPKIASSINCMRQGLPLQFLDYMGAVHDNRQEKLPEPLKNMKGDGNGDDEQQIGNEEYPEALEKQHLQEEFRAQAKKRIMKVAKEAMDMVDAACDQLGKRFISDRLPPALTPSEKQATSEADDTQGKIQIMPNHLCRMVRPGIARLVLENGMAVLYHCIDNSLVYHENPVSPMEFEVDDAPAMEQLLTTVEPHWIAVADLIHDSIEDKVGVAQALFDEGILAVRGMDDG